MSDTLTSGGANAGAGSSAGISPSTPTLTAEPRMSVRSVSKSYTSDRGVVKRVLASVSFNVAPEEFVAIVGPSGAGKTTLLRTIAGLMLPTSGEIFFDGDEVTGPPERLALVFQDYSRSLMPWMTIEKNVTLPLRRKKLSKDEQKRLAAEALSAVGLGDIGSHYPWQLSGGMQQRVAIARAIAYQPDALLMDEPFASVDAQTRSDLEDLILALKKQYGMTIVVVTHDIDEAVYMSDRVIVLSGSPTSVRQVVDVKLGGQRDQLVTKSLPEFVELRNTVLTAVRRPVGEPSP
ncbi:ABC transporter ATP-binding protein [Subtercola lobariae]|uniref:ABC transporter n=1 Tax=Subtercola lobariae TaxID=1588641 RepID=A0A917B082_9MICO|nr:ABC transporter ATP-binding protein [Subtercola lobariae]GGF11851.1 ABC transporter [Subtercola lobariae]